MSYAAGMALGVSLGQKIFELFADGEHASEQLIKRKAQPSIKLVHKLKGRRRYNLKILLNNMALSVMLEKYLLKLDCIKDVSANPVTGSLLLIYDCDDSKIDNLMNELKERVFINQKRANLELAGLGRTIYDFFISWNNCLKEKTTKKIDLRSLTAVIFIVTGIRKLWLERQLPGAPQLLWWAFSLLRRWG